MAYALLDDKYGEIEVVIFARQYAKISYLIAEDNAVVIEGRLSVEEGEGAKILLSSAEELLNDSEYKADEAKAKPVKEQKLYIKLDDLSDARTAAIYRISSLNPGKCPIVLFDAGSGKYVAMKNTYISPGDKVLVRLRSLYGDANVVLK